ncbi:MAG: peptidase U32 family protein [Sodaliphilus pleomorphus]|uniref:peptidase U32 family protein n=1 Tax=Sodaliphilus pleomorphus TaxID=2606626 RepID=UPI0023F13A7E|nr:peptidase U32 family protein [Sodaliphilus pleomorphus]MDD7066300.1 U32 family peptidase [Sodaliphilus pleomorphus]MDY2832339.1 peptidase U32 family protein [Sodaliphilus pleomorphus]MDY6251754.1 peptidase U32 family protein [Bacteroidales bacterium]
MQRSDFEIMAPVGSWESLTAAAQGGADAIYFGIEGLNMRSKSSVNFSLDDLNTIAAWCHERHMKSYLTVNTIIYDDDIDYMHKIVDAARQAGITAIIACDMATIVYARQVGVEVHISTQVNVSNSEAVRFYSQWADVMVLARELNLDQVKKIYDTIERDNVRGPHGEPVRIEMFCHGALCMAISGKCYMSLHQTGASANRGACRQMCRRSYIVTDRDTGEELAIDNKYIMSPKDLKTIHFLNKMVDAGVRVFKIEGRARGPEYVRTVASCYNEALASIIDGTYSEAKIEDWNTRLARVFNRGFWNGYYLGQRLGEWSAKYGSSATRVKQYAAKGVRYFSRLGVAEFLMEAGELHVGDNVLIEGPTTGAVPLTLTEIRVDLKPVEHTVKGEHFSIKTDVKVRPSDKLYLWRDVERPAGQRRIE